ncbi:MAG: hypothetical protein ABSD29_20640, partial [Verrucomicrobiota bacterium]
SWSASDCPKHEFVSESVIKYARLRAFRAILQVPSAFLRLNGLHEEMAGRRSALRRNLLLAGRLPVSRVRCEQAGE